VSVCFYELLSNITRHELKKELKKYFSVASFSPDCNRMQTADSDKPLPTIGPRAVWPLLYYHCYYAVSALCGSVSQLNQQNYSQQSYDAHWFLPQLEKY